ncbi:hypothetical protein Tco_1172747 [Tanacetum coccineum]
MPSLSEAEVKRLLSLPTPPPSPLISLSPPSVEERFARCLAAPALPSPPLPPLPSSLYLPPPVPTSLPAPSPPLPPLPTFYSMTHHKPNRENGHSRDLLEVIEQTMGLSALWMPRDQTSKSQGGCYGIRDVWVDPSEAIKNIAPTTLEGVNAKIDSLIKESRRIDRGKSISPRECVADGVGGFSFSRGLGTVSGIEFDSLPRAAGI